MRRALAVVLLLGASGCLATKNDFYTIQREQQALRALLESQDAARQRQADSIARANGNLLSSRFNTLQSDQARLIQSVTDSLRALSRRQTDLRYMLNDTLASMSNQLNTLGARTGNAQTFTNQLKTQLEAVEAAVKRLNELVDVLIRAQGASATGAAPDTTLRAMPPDTPLGPRQLLEEGQRYLRAMSCGTGRESLDELLKNHPTSEVAPDARLYIGHSFKDCDVPGNPKKADSVYAEVVRQHPRTSAAAKALFGRGVIACSNNDARAAVAYFQLILKDYTRVVGADDVLGQSRQYVANGCF
jgi:TolA-binding protein